MPDRLAEIKNVKDFGALGNGSHDDSSNIQAAIDWTSGANRGVIYFPLGSYRVTKPLTFNYNGNLSIAFVGQAGTIIFAAPSFNDYVFKRSLVSPNNTTGGRIFEKLNIQNSAGGEVEAVVLMPDETKKSCAGRKPLDALGALSMPPFGRMTSSTTR
jgi:polygalacturonase